MARKWMVSEATAAILDGDVQARIDVGRRFPLYATALTNPAELLKQINFISVRVLERRLKALYGLIDDDEDEDEAPAPKAKAKPAPAPKAPSKRKPAVEEDDEEDDGEDGEEEEEEEEEEAPKAKPANVIKLKPGETRAAANARIAAAAKASKTKK